MDVFCNFVFPAWCLCCKRNVKIWSCYSNQLFINPPEPWDLQRQLEAPGAPALCWSTPTNKICTLDFLEVWWLMTHTHLGLFLKNPMIFFYSFPTASLWIIKDETLKMLLTHQPVSSEVEREKNRPLTSRFPRSCSIFLLHVKKATAWAFTKQKLKVLKPTSCFVFS